MLTISDISYSVEGRPLFEGASATIPDGHKVGLVGRNGTGKTTLFNLIKGELTLEGGSISLPSRAPCLTWQVGGDTGFGAEKVLTYRYGLPQSPTPQKECDRKKNPKVKT